MSLNGFILAAGFGKRMGEYTKKIPKPLLPVGGVPLIYYSLYNLYRWKIQKIYINVHYRSEQIVEALKDYPFAELTFSEEKDILGTAGGIRTALGKSLRQNLVLMNPDSILLPSEEDHPGENLLSDSFGTLLYLAERDINSKETALNLLPDGRIHFENEGKYFYMGYSLLNAQILSSISPNTVKELGEIWRSGESVLSGRVFRGSYFDCGNEMLYKDLKDRRIFSDTDEKWKFFRKSCGLLSA